MLVEHLNNLFVKNDSGIQLKADGCAVKINGIDTVLPSLPNVFELPESEFYDDPEICFQDGIYSFMIFHESDNNDNEDDFILECKLSKNWLNDKVDLSGGNHLWALVNLVKKEYGDLLEISVEECN